MKILTFSDYDEASRKTAEFIVDFVNNKPDALLSFPAGHTSLGTFKYLAGYAAQGKADFNRCTFVGLDEWVGLGKNDEGSCEGFMYKNLFKPLNINPKNIVFFDANADDLGQECQRMDSFIRKNEAIDLMLLGAGMNGHLGLNEPGISPDLHSHVTELDPLTKVVGQKYFEKPVKLEKGITLGLKTIMETRTVVLQITGSNKAEIARKIVNGGITTDVPASILKNHSNAYLFLDSDAASLLKSGCV